MARSAVLLERAATGTNTNSCILHQTDALKQPDREWAELDDIRLVWASGGQLWAGAVTDIGLAESRLLHDFNGMTFERRTASY